ncbi:period protein [Lasius niger]|uniref:Period protein n=1 Tax=Lasius niger TaxID=67767 RepID=A0A0J7NCB0_LASNI|nr:period protein [Lasius niger]
MFPDVTVDSMRLLVIAAIVLADFSLADLDLRGAKCGEKRCNVSEYCSSFDTHCRPCAVACDMKSHNYQPEECVKDCQGESSIQHRYDRFFNGLKGIKDDYQ